MAKKKKSKGPGAIAENRRARYDFEIGDTYEAGLVLLGSEIKSLRNGHAQIAESYVSAEDDEIWLINSYIPEYLQANRYNHEERRRRKLLLSKKEIKDITVGLTRHGMTMVPLKMYFNERGKVKLFCALAKGKKEHDKRQTERARDWNREKSRLMKQHN